MMSNYEEVSNGKETVIQMSTIVFLDFESTGLNRARITELCLLAISRADLIDANAFPRVTNKLVLCLNPMKPIENAASHMTGLYNDGLEHQQPWGVNTVNLIQNFLDHLAPPICLVAHNGNGFDFPLLMAELARVNQSLSENLYCADSLEAFRELDGLTRKYEKNGYSATKVKTSVESPVNTPPTKLAEASKPPAVKRKSLDNNEMYDKCSKLHVHNSRNGCHDNAKVRKKLDFDRSEVEDTAEGRHQSADKPELVFSQSLEDSDYLMALEMAEKELGLDKETQKTTDSEKRVSVTTSQNLSLDRNSNTEQNIGESDSKTEVKLDPCPVAAGSGYLVVNTANETSSTKDVGQELGSSHVSDTTSDNIPTSMTDISTNDHSLKNNENLNSPENNENLNLSKEVVKKPIPDSDISCEVSSTEIAGPANALQGVSNCPKETQTASTSHTPVVSRKWKSYKLDEIYFRTFGKFPEVRHSAEADCIAMMQVVTKTPRFIEWIETNAVLLSCIQPKPS